MTTPAVLTQPTTMPPPKVGGYPLVGALPGLVKRRLDFLEANRRQHGEIFTLDLGFTSAVILCHPRHAQHVLADNVGNYAKGGALWESIRTLLGNGLPVSEGDYWKRQRRMMQPAFHHQKLVALTEKIVEAIDESLTEGWGPAASSGEPFDVTQAFTRMTMKVLARTMFGSEVGAEETARVAEALTYAIDYIPKRMVTKALPGWMPVPGLARYQEALKSIDELIFRVIERGRKSAEAGNNLLSLLLNATDDESTQQMTDEQLRDEAVALFLAGYETTAGSLAWAFHILSQQPEFAQRVHTEVDGVLGSRTPAFEDLFQLGLARNVLQETLRLHPPSYWIPRTAVKDDEIDGYRIPAGSTVAVMTYLIHRHPDIWDNPLAVDPDRFLPKRSEGRHKMAWIPFGAGQRLCIGKEFALMEGQLIIARVLQRYNVEAVPGRVAQMHLSTTLRTKDGVWVKLKAR
jgi:cytochrome P450